MTLLRAALPTSSVPASAALLAASLLGCSGGAAVTSSTQSSTNVADGGTAADAGSGASLVSLSVSPLALTPAFQPRIHDYYVRCGAGTNTLTVSAEAAGGATVALTQPTSSALGASVDIAESGAIVVTATSGAGATPYWIRCLPHDFPQIIVSGHPDAGTPTPGYYLFANVLPNNGESLYAMVVDGNGVPVWYRPSPLPTGLLNVQLLAPGQLSFTPFLAYTFSAASEGSYELVQLSPWQVTTIATSGIPLDSHELRALPNGDYMMISDVIRTTQDLTGFLTFGPGSPMIDCVVQEVDPSGNLVWQWDALDHFDPVADSTYPQTGTTDTGETVADPFHCNAIDVAASGDLLVSSRHMDSVFYVSKSSGAVAWKMGGARASKDGATYLQITGDPQTAFYRQHDARFLGDGTRVSLFDDRTAMSGAARGVVYAVDPTAGTATFTSQCVGWANSAYMGSYRVAADGSSVVGWGQLTSGATPILTEFDASGNDLLDISFDSPSVSYRAIKVAADALDIDVLRATAGTP